MNTIRTKDWRKARGTIGAVLSLMVAMITPVAGAPASSWTVMAYLDGYSDLQPAAHRYLAQLFAGERHPQVRVVAQVNRQEDGDSALMAARYYYDELGARQRQQVGRDDAEAGQGLATFIKWAMQQAPARHYALLIMGHGQPAVAGQEETLRGEQIAAAVRAASRGTGPIAAIFLDCCYGATLEMVWQLRDVAHYLVGPPGLMYSPGLPWASILGHLQRQPQITGTELARVAVTAAGKYWQSEPDLPAALVAIDLRRLDLIIGTLAGLSQSAVAQMPAIAAEVALARSQAMAWGPQGNVADLGGFATVLAEISTNPDLARHAWEVSQAVREATVASHIQGHSAAGKTRGMGISIFFPLNLELDRLPLGYGQLAQMGEQSGWSLFLQSYLTHVGRLVTAEGSGLVSGS